jgi:hypothetical protein
LIQILQRKFSVKHQIAPLLFLLILTLLTKNTAGSIIRAIKPAFTSPSDLAEIATQKTLDQVGGDMSKTTPELALKQLDNLTNAAKIQKDAIYTARNAQADKEGATVNFNNLKDDILFYAKGKNFTQTRQGTNLIDKVSSGSDLTYGEAQDVIKLIGGNATTAKRQGDRILSDELSNLKDSLLSTVDQSGRSAELDALHQHATDFYKNVYVPLRDADAAKILVEKQSEGAYIASAVKSLLNDKKLYGAFAAANKEGLQNNMEQTIAAAHVNALKDAAATNGMINPLTYGNSLAKTLKDNPIPLKSVADKLTALGKALDVVKQYQGLRGDLSQHSLGQKIGMSVMTGLAGAGGYAAGGVGGGAAVGAASYLLPKAKYLYAAGKMLNNPETANLLGIASKVSEKTDPNVAQAIYKNVADKFNLHLSTIPARLEPIFNGSAPQEQSE